MSEAAPLGVRGCSPMHPTLQPYVLPAAAPPPIGRNAPALAPAPGQGWGEAWGGAGVGLALGLGWGWVEFEARARAVRCEHLPPLGAYIHSLCVPCLPCDLPTLLIRSVCRTLPPMWPHFLVPGAWSSKWMPAAPACAQARSQPQAHRVAASGTQGCSLQHRVAACEHLGLQPPPLR